MGSGLPYPSSAGRKERVMQVLQCPKCEVRFHTSSELNDHVVRDHPDFHATSTNVEDDLLAACHCHHHGGNHRAA